MFHTQYPLDLFVADRYGLRNTICTFWGTYDLASAQKEVDLVFLVAET
jgi:hypothetical protein